MTTEDPAVSGQTPDMRSFAASWTVHLAVLGALIVALLAFDWRMVVAAVDVWWVSPTYSHCFLIIPVSGYLIWLRRKSLARLVPAAYPRALWLAIPVIVFSGLGALMAVNEFQQLALIAFVQIMTLAVLGPQVYRRILFPSLYLFFLVPMGEYLIGPLQRFTTQFISVGLNILGILHYTEGNTIQLANGIYEVAEACAGLRFLIATIAVGVLFAYFTYRKWHKIVLFLVACMIVPVIGNGFRALGIVLLAHFSDNRIATGADHLIYGWGFSVAILALLMYVGMKFADPIEPEDAAPPPRVAASGSLPLAAVIGFAVIVVVPAFFLWRAQAAPLVDTAAFSRPLSPAGWTVGPVTGEWTPLYAAPDAQLAFSMHDATPFSPPVDVIVDYYAPGDDNHNLITSTNKLWDEDSWHPVIQDHLRARLGDAEVPVGEVEIAAAGVNRLIWWTYVAGGQFTTSGITVKLARLKSLRGDSSALVTVSTDINSDVGAARERLRQAFAALGGLRQRLAK